MKLSVADSHNDLLMAVRHLRERGHDDPFGDFWLPQLKAGGVTLQVLPVCTEEQFVGEGALRHCLLMLEEARHLAEIHVEEVAIVESAAEIEATLDSGRIALLLAIEGAEPIGHSLAMLDVMWRAGVRMCSLSWNRRTMMADGVAEHDTGGKLTRLGVDAVRRMEELGVIVDVSHLSEAGFYHLAEVATKPFIASHSSCRSVTNHPRNLSDEQLQVVRGTNSFVAINAFGPFISNSAPSIDSYLDHVQHAISVVGPEKVGLGTDFIDDIAKIVDPIFTGLLLDSAEIPKTKGLQRPEDFSALATAMNDRFGTNVATKVMGRNLHTFLASQLG
ncbi:MAG: membrane dipeptidase [Mycetocola sp.]